MLQIHTGHSHTLKSYVAFPGGVATLSSTSTGGCCYLETGELLLLSQSLFDQNTFDALLHRVLLCLRTANSQSQDRIKKQSEHLHQGGLLQA